MPLFNKLVLVAPPPHTRPLKNMKFQFFSRSGEQGPFCAVSLTNSLEAAVLLILEQANFFWTLAVYSTMIYSNIFLHLLSMRTLQLLTTSSSSHSEVGRSWMKRVVYLTRKAGAGKSRFALNTRLNYNFVWMVYNKSNRQMHHSPMRWQRTFSILWSSQIDTRNGPK